MSEAASSARRRLGEVPDVEFSGELRDDVLAGHITLSVRLWKRPRVKQGGRCARAITSIGQSSPRWRTLPARTSAMLLRRLE